MIFRRRRDSTRDHGVVHPKIFDDRLGRMLSRDELSSSEMAERWREGWPLHIVPAVPVGADVAWAITARAGRDFVVHRYAPGGRQVQSTRWQQIGDRVRVTETSAWFPWSSDSGHEGTAYLVTWRGFTGGALRIETVGPSPSDDDVLVAQSGPAVVDDRPVPDLDSVVDLLEVGTIVRPDAVSDDPAVAVQTYLRELTGGVTPRAADGVFGPESLRDGAVVLATDRQIVAVVDLLQRQDASSIDGPASSRIPVLRRGAAVIVPIGAQGSSAQRWRDRAEELSELVGGIRRALDHRAGQGRVLKPESAVGYARSLMEAGATWGVQWQYVPDRAVLLVLTGDPEDGTRSAALHLVPGDWVSGDAPTEAAAAWSWADVVGAAGSLAGADEEEQGR